MAETENNDYIEISIKLVLLMKSALPFDLYIKRTETKYSKLVNKGDTIDLEQVKRYAAKGIKYFYVTDSDFGVYSEHVTNLSRQLIDDKSSERGRKDIEILKELVGLSVYEISKTFKVDENTATNAALVVNESINFVEKDVGFAIRLINMMSAREYLLKKSIAVSILSIILAKKLGIVSKRNLQIIGLGGLMHDIGISMLSFNPEENPELTREQRLEMNRHTEIGKQAIDGNPAIPREVALIVAQHHEQPNGLGYPGNLKDHEIYPPAKIVGVVSCFVALVSKRPFRPPMPVKDALGILQDSPGKFDQNVLRSFINILTLDQTKVTTASTFSDE